MPLGVAVIEARYGSSVASYFHFFRWVIINYVVLSLLCVVFLVLHVSHLLRVQACHAARRPLCPRTSLPHRAAQLAAPCRTSQYLGAAPVQAEAAFPMTYTWNRGRWSDMVGLLPRFLQYSSFSPGASADSSGERLTYSLLLIAGGALLTAVGIQ